MSFSDDDDIVLSGSHQDYFTHADKGRKDALKRELAKELGAQSTAHLQEQVDLQQLKSQIAGQKDEETKRKEDSDRKAEQSSAPKTMTRKEEEEAAVETAQKQDSPDSLIDEQQRQPEVSDEETQSEPG